MTAKTYQPGDFEPRPNDEPGVAEGPAGPAFIAAVQRSISRKIPKAIEEALASRAADDRAAKEFYSTKSKCGRCGAIVPVLLLSGGPDTLLCPDCAEVDLGPAADQNCPRCGQPWPAGRYDKETN